MFIIASRLSTLNRAFGSSLRDGTKQLHLCDVEIGRILLRREGYTGSLDELRRIVGKFDERVRASCRGSAVVHEASLPPPLDIPQEATEPLYRKQTKWQAESAVVDSQTHTIKWMHVPDVAQDALMRNQRRAILALSLVAGASPLSGVAEITLTAHANGT